MKRKALQVFASGLLLICGYSGSGNETQASGNDASSSGRLKLWYQEPAQKWIEALPVGNGRLGAMIFGGVNEERLQLNEDTLWAGGPYDPVNPEAASALPEARRLIIEGKFKEADSLIGKKVMAKPLRQMPYETLGNLVLRFQGIGSVTDYRRELNLDSALAKVSFSANGVQFAREAFASPVDQVIVVRLSAARKGALSFIASLQSPQHATVSSASPDTLILSGTNGASDGIPGALNLQTRVRVLAQGAQPDA